MAKPYQHTCRLCGAPRDPAIKKRALCRACNRAIERSKKRTQPARRGKKRIVLLREMYAQLGLVPGQVKARAHLP